jgi:hypothetical protein
MFPENRKTKDFTPRRQDAKKSGCLRKTLKRGVSRNGATTQRKANVSGKPENQ